MYLSKLEIKNFRLLENIELFLEKQTTVIVGRNNSGKTSLTELFRRLLSEKTPSFLLEDFSLSVHEKFWDAFLLHLQEGDEAEIRTLLPAIETRLFVEYEKSASTYPCR